MNQFKINQDVWKKPALEVFPPDFVLLSTRNRSYFEGEENLL